MTAYNRGSNLRMGDKNRRINMDEIIKLFQKRRSCRKYKSLPIDSRILDEITEAGQYAPSGGNSKTARIIIFQNQNLIQELEKIAEDEFAAMESGPDTYKSLRTSIVKSKEGGYHFTYGAPVLILICNKKDYGNSMADCACIAENMMLAATAYQIGSCYVNQIHWLTDSRAVREFLKRTGLQEDEDVYCGIILGHPEEPEFFDKKRTLKKNTVVTV